MAMAIRKRSPQGQPTIASHLGVNFGIANLFALLDAGAPPHREPIAAYQLFSRDCPGSDGYYLYRSSRRDSQWRRSALSDSSR